MSHALDISIITKVIYKITKEEGNIFLTEKKITLKKTDRHESEYRGFFPSTFNQGSVLKYAKTFSEIFVLMFKKSF